MSRKLVHLAGAACGQDLEPGLDAIRQMRDELAKCEAEHVATALDQGWSWARIGRALGISRQAVHRRYAQRPPLRPERRRRRRAALSQRARFVLALARSEAAARRDAVTATEHILLGLVQEGEGPAARALLTAGVDLGALRAAADALCPSGLVHVPPSQLALSRRAHAALANAVREAVNRGDAEVTDADLLRALLAMEDSGAVYLIRTLKPVRKPAERPAELVL